MSSNAQTNCYHTADSGQHHTKLWISRDLKYKLGTVVFMFSSGLYFVSLVSHPWFEIHEWNLYAVHPIVEWSLITELPTKFCTYDNSECIGKDLFRSFKISELPSRACSNMTPTLYNIKYILFAYFQFHLPTLN